MRAQTEEELYRTFCAGSKILNTEKHKKAGTFWIPDLSKEGIQGMLGEHLNENDGSFIYARQ
jgi:hypothetical protein